MIIHENCLLADESHEKSFFIFFSEIRNDVAKFVACCSCDWRFKGYLLLCVSKMPMVLAKNKNMFLVIVLVLTLYICRVGII